MRCPPSNTAVTTDLRAAGRRSLWMPLVAAAVLGVMATQAAAQATSSSVVLAVQVGAQIRVHDAGASTVIARRAGSVDVARSVAVGSNVDYRLAVRATSLAPNVIIKVEDASGSWIPLVAGQTVTVSAGQHGRSTRTLVYRLESSNPSALSTATVALVIEAHSASVDYPAVASAAAVIDTNSTTTLLATAGE